MESTKIKASGTGKIRLSASDKILDCFIAVFFILFLIVVIYPLIFIVSSSFSSGNAVSQGKVIFMPVDFSLNGYKIVFSNRSIWIAYGNTIFYTIFGTMINVFLTVLAAYPLSRRVFQWKNIYMTLFMIPMFFSGGLIPTYLLMSNLHLTNTRWAVLLLGALSTYNMIVTKTFFQNSIPHQLLEAAKIDGVDDFGYFIQILLPLSKPIIAVISLYYAVGHWNSYFNALIYLRDVKLQPLQLLLRSVLRSADINLTEVAGDAQALAKQAGAADVMKYALIVVSVVPILVLYPFVQKFFEKGVMIGSVKG